MRPPVCPTISLSASGLPVWQARDDFVKMLHTSQTLILVGETGSGKTTQIAQFIADAGYCSSGKKAREQRACGSERGSRGGGGS